MLHSHWLDILLSIGFAQGIFIAFVLWQKKPSNQPAVRHLVWLIVFLSAIMLGRASYQPDFFQRFSEIIMLPDAILFLIGPSIYFFTRTLLQLPMPEWSRRIWHFFPAIFHVLVFNTIIGLHLNGTFAFLEIQHIRWLFMLLIAAVIFSLSFYLYLSYRDFRLYQKAWQERFTSEFPVHFLRPFFIFGFVIMGCWAAIFLYELIQQSTNYLGYWVMWTLLVSYVFFLAYKVILRPELLDLPQLKTSVEVPDETLEKVVQHMQSEKPFLDPGLKIGDLAENLEMPKHELSKILNHAFGKNFFDYLNEHRVREFISMRQDLRYSHLNISDLAFQSGFNSRTSFNRAFRKETGLTPSEYFKGHTIPSEN